MHLRKIAVSASLAIAVLFLYSSAWSQEFAPYERNKALRERDGGAKKPVNGIDFWSGGEPPVRCKLLGYITDRRHRTGIIGKISMSSLESDVAEVAKKPEAMP